jgi:hypothetical protein
MTEISTESIKHLQNIPLKFKNDKYPVCGDPNLTRMFFVALFIGSRGAGKTYAATQLISLYEKYGLFEKGKKIDIRTIVLSPTISANKVFSALQSLDKSDIHENYSDHLLLEIADDIKNEKKETEDYKIKMKVWKKFLKMKSEKDLQKLDPLELQQLEMDDYQEPKKPRFPLGVANFIVLDDLVGSSAFRSVGKSALTNMVLKNRHLAINFLILTQNLKAIPRSIRTNTSLFVIYRFASQKVICQDLWEEVSNCITVENFEKIFHFATEGEHNALVIDFSQPKDARFKKNFGTILRI